MTAVSLLEEIRPGRENLTSRGGSTKGRKFQADTCFGKTWAPAIGKCPPVLRPEKRLAIVTQWIYPSFTRFN